MLTVTNDADTRMLDITITSPSAEEAAMIANEYADVASRYIEETMSTDRPNIMSTALVPVNPVSPNKTLNVLLGFCLLYTSHTVSPLRGEWIEIMIFTKIA